MAQYWYWTDPHTADIYGSKDGINWTLLPKQQQGTAVNGGNWTTTTQASGSSLVGAGSTNLGTCWPVAFAANATISTGSPMLGAVEDAGVRAGEIIAYRAWRLVGDELRSMFWPYTWVPKEVNRADDVASDSPCGFYAFKQLAEARKQYGDVGPVYEPGERTVFGSVKLWGTVIEHSKGYRAEFAKINTLDEVTNGESPYIFFRKWRSRRHLRPVRERYGISG